MAAGGEEKVENRIEVLPPGMRFVNEGFEVTTSAQGIGYLEVDFSAAAAFRERLAGEGLAVSNLPLLLKAVARALDLEPQAHAFLQGSGRTIVHPGRVDIGVSVAGRGNYAPVAVLEGVREKDLAALLEDLRRLSAEKRAGEERELWELGWLHRILLFGWLRRAALALGLRFFPIARQKMGTIQVSTLPFYDHFWPLKFGTGCVIALGKVAPRPRVVDGEVRAVPVGCLTIGIDHKVLDGVKSGRFMAEIKRVLEDPNELDGFLKNDWIPDH